MANLSTLGTFHPAVHMSSGYHRGAWIGLGYCDDPDCERPDHIAPYLFWCSNPHCGHVSHRLAAIEES